ncbi:YrhK family protein [Methyloligella sp. 2.7D]|uniref:YrhK family protein n=1 Tax=unclassified Methyloligella TaxID=2625955 RepID=UPI00157C0346|nr:YrhK family protein [Methyloligella sp. GL2]QKP76860.1 YrhK family protein [Methyloligella sp. GL2]
MTTPIQLIVHKYGWVHQVLGVLGNTAFVVGSVMFLPRFPSWYSFAVWLFIVGSALMLIGALGRLAMDLVEPE